MFPPKNSIVSLGLIVCLMVAGGFVACAADQAESSQTQVTLDIEPYLNVTVVEDPETGKEIELEPVRPDEIVSSIANNTTIDRTVPVTLVIDSNIDATLGIVKTLNLDHQNSEYQVPVSTTLFILPTDGFVYSSGDQWAFDIVHPGFPNGVFLTVVLSQVWSMDIPAGDYSGTLTFEVIGS